ncbi:MAG: Uma2 family endonuclease [Propionibacteriales bacterium]|nr:Uma2 family endonuclease [Propionibacteriales bacterium]
METVTTLPRSRPFTRADLDSMPDDGHRYELIDGNLVVTPAPAPRHQRVVLSLAVLLREGCPAELEVFIAPLDVVLASDTVMQPDVLVARRVDVTERDLPTAPVLAVEVLSPSTRRLDRTLKRSRFQEAGCPSYWVVDPDEPSLTAWDLHDRRYTEAAHVVGDQTYAARLPYPVDIQPAGLVEG